MRAQFFTFAFHEFYNRFAFTYDAVSAIVSRGGWRAWTRAALPFLHGARVLEVACGSGNLQLDLWDAGYRPFGVDLSPDMLELTRHKLRAAERPLRLARADARDLPFATGAFSSVILTFPPGFVRDPRALAELRRVLEPGGALVWVDAAKLDERDAWSRFLNWAFQLTGTGPAQDDQRSIETILSRGAEDWPRRCETVRFSSSQVQVWIAFRPGG